MRPAVLMLAASLPAGGGGAAPLAAAPSRNVAASLVSDVAAIQAGRPFRVGLRLEMAEGWHTYWKNPGDAGLATRLRWTLPAGFTAGPLEWPAPGRFAQGPLVSYGYDGEVVLLTAITPPSDLKAGSTHRLAARADWLECRDICLPGRADLEMVLPVGPAAADPKGAPLMARFQSRVPRPAVGWSAGVLARRDGFILSWPSPPGPDGQEAYFFPETKQVVAYGEPQAFTRAQATRRLQLSRDPNAVPTNRLEGVLVLGGGNDARAYSLEMETRNLEGTGGSR